LLLTQDNTSAGLAAVALTPEPLAQVFSPITSAVPLRAYASTTGTAGHRSRIFRDASLSQPKRSLSSGKLGAPTPASATSGHLAIGGVSTPPSPTLPATASRRPGVVGTVFSPSRPTEVRHAELAPTTASSLSMESPSVRVPLLGSREHSDDHAGRVRAVSLVATQSRAQSQAASSARFPLNQIDRRSGDIRQNALVDVFQDIRKARATRAPLDRWVDRPAGSTPEARINNLVVREEPLTVLRTETAHHQALPLPAHPLGRAWPIAPEETGFVSIDSARGIPLAVAAGESMSPPFQAASIAPFPLNQIDRRSGDVRQNALVDVVQDIRVARATRAPLDRWVDRPLGSSRAARINIAVRGAPATVLRSETAHREGFLLPTFPHARTPPIEPDGPTIKPNGNFIPVDSARGIPLAVAAGESLSLPFQAASTAPLPFHQIDRHSGDIRQNAPVDVVQDIRVAPVAGAHLGRSVFRPLGSSRAARIIDTAARETAMMVPHPEAAPQHQAFLRPSFGPIGIPPTVTDGSAVKSDDKRSSLMSKVGSALALVAAMPASRASEPASFGSSSLMQASRSFGLDGLRIAAEDVPITSAMTARPEQKAYLHVVGSSPVLTARSGTPVKHGAGANVEAFPSPGSGLWRAHPFPTSAPLLLDGRVANVSEALPIERSAMPTGIGLPILAKGPALGVLDQGSTERMTTISAFPLTGYTTAANRQLTESAPSARGASALAAGSSRANSMLPLLADLSAEPGAGDLPARRARSDNGPYFPNDSRDAMPAEPPRNYLSATIVLRRQVAAVRSDSPHLEGSQGVAIPAMLARAGAPVPYGAITSTLVPGPESPGDVDQTTSAPARTLPRDSDADADEIVERAWREVMSRLAIEKERRGFGRWS
jgi:hypothetical protein